MPHLRCAATLLLAASPLLAGAQTSSTPTTPATPVHHATGHPVRPKTPVCAPAAAPAPVLPAGIPPAAGVVSTAFALRYIDIAPGTGELVSPTDFVTVHYTGWLASDGTKFDSSVDRGEPFTFVPAQHRVIPGWYNGFGGMHVGGKRRLFIPYQMAYGELGRPPVIPEKSDLIFDIEVLSASATPPPPPAPPAQPAPQ